MSDASSKPYRFNVGVALFNARGQVFIGRAISDGPEYVLPDYEWQMPQGGIDPQEDIIEAARRELHEETGITRATFLAATSDWWAYDFPPSLRAFSSEVETSGGLQSIPPSSREENALKQKDRAVVRSSLIENRSKMTGHKLEKFRGQQQRYVAFRFEGEDAEIDLGKSGQDISGADFYPEFSDWRWASLAEVVSGVMPYKRANYEKMAAAFAAFAIV